LGERLLCKQEVVGSIPSASMVCALARWGCVVTEEMERFGPCCLMPPPLGGVWRAWSVALWSLWIVNQVLVRLWTRGTPRWVWAALSVEDRAAWTGRGGPWRFGLGCLTWVLGAARAVPGPKAKCVGTRVSAGAIVFRGVLSVC